MSISEDVQILAIFSPQAWLWHSVRSILMAWCYVSRQFSPPFPCTLLILSTYVCSALCLRCIEPVLCVCLCVIMGRTEP